MSELFHAMLPVIPVVKGCSIIYIFNNVYYLVNNVSFLPELCRCDDLNEENQEEVNSEKHSSSSEGLPEGHQSVIVLR